MTAIFTGLGAGYARGSGNVIGGAGQLGNASQGRADERVSVNAATGNLLITKEDELLFGRGLDIAISRTYNSVVDTTDGDNADQWQMGTYRRIFGLTGTQNATGSTIKRQAGDGSVIIYTWDATKSAYISKEGDGAFDSLTFATGVWTWKDGSTQIAEGYLAYGADNWRITEQKDTDGYKLTFTYVADKLDKVTTASGEWTQYTWSGNNLTQITTGYTNLATATASTLARTRYGYDASNRLNAVLTDLSPNDNSVGDGNYYAVYYTYDGISKRVATITQSDGSRLDIVYDGSFRVSTLTQLVAAGDPRVTTLSYGTNFTTITGPDNQITRMDYDTKKQLTKITAPPATAGATAQTVLFLYDTLGNVTRVTDAKAKATNFTYDANGNQLTSTDPNVNAVTRTYGLKNELLTETMTGSDATGAAVAHTTRYAYDSENHLRYVVSAEGLVTEFYYDEFGQNYWTVEYPQAAYSLTGLTATDTISEGSLNAWRSGFDNTRSKITYTTFDTRGNVNWSRSAGSGTAGWGNYSTAEGYTDTGYTYDQAGRLLSTNKSGEVAETFVYDGLGRIIASADLNGGTTTLVFSDATTTTTVTTASGFVSTSTYNKAGDLISQTTSGSYDPIATTTYKYDKLGRVRQATEATGGNSYYLYDKAGRRTAEINHYGWIVEFQYDANNRVIGEGRYVNGVSAAHLATLADPNNSLDIATIRPVGHYLDIWFWTVYDNGGRVIETIDGSGGASKFEYDKSDRLIKTTSYFNKLTQVQVDGFKITPPAVLVAPIATSSKDNITRSFYDSDGRQIGSLDALGYLTEVIYDKAGQKVEDVAYAAKTTSTTSATDSFATLRGTVAPTAAANIRTRYVYDGQGLLRYSVNAQGGVASFVYNTASKLTTTTQYAAAIATSTIDFSYANIKALVSAITNATNDRTSSLAYDIAGRVATSTDVSGLVTSFTYDIRGQVIKTVAGSGGEARTTRNYYSAAGDLRFSVDAEGYVMRYDYDADGRKVRDVVWNNKIVASDATTISQVSSLADASGAWVDNNYSYYANGELYSTWDGEGVRTLYSRFANGTLDGVYSAYGTLDQALMLYRYDGAGRVTSEYHAYGETEGTIAQYAFDGMGNRTSMTDANGKVTTYTYDKLGQMLSMTNALVGVTAYQYDGFGQVVKATDARGYASYNYYDNLGRLTLNRDAESYLTETSYNVFGEVANVTRRYTKTATVASTITLPTTTANAKDATTSFVYDKRGLVTSSTDAEGFFQSFGYNALGNRISSTAKSATTAIAAGGTTTYAYDKRGQLVSETLPVGSYNALGTLVSSTVTNNYSYDARSNRVQMIEAAGLAEARTTVYVYDKNNRLIDMIGQTFLSQTPHNYYKYDARGNLTETIDPSGARTIFFYDDLNRKVVEINAVGTYSAYSYDANDNVTTVRVYGSLVGLPAKGGSKAEAPGAPGSGYRETVFTYDNIDRMVTSAVTGVNSYIFDGTNYVLQATSLSTSYQYDANGNVVKLTDANGNATFSYYDKLGRKTAQSDADRYLTTWTYDSEGNVLTEKRSANQATAPVVGTVPTVVADGVNDRTTTFIYDRNGNRTRETRSVVLVHNGLGGTSSVSAAINYLYNGLGQVVRKTEGTNDQINYLYDAGGRLTNEQRAAFTAFDGSAVTPTVDYFYNGIGNLSRTVAVGAGDAAARVTTYVYDGDKLRYMTDASGFARYYWYDVGGRITADYYTRLKSDGTQNASYDGSLTSYDLLNRAVVQYQATYEVATGWTLQGPYTNTAYNAYGEVQSLSVGSITQQNNQYDAGGRLIATNSGDGVWKYFGYDANGNQTAAITSAGANLAGQSFAGALSLVGQSDVNATYTRYDTRNLATTVVEEGRQLSSTAALQILTTTRGYNAFGEVIAETNANNATVNYTYNTMGRLIKSESPLVSVTGENGVASNVRPTENYYYDAGGRLVASRDANGNLTKLTLLAGTGYGGGQALVLTEIHADGGIKANGFDIHGDLRKITDEINRSTTQSFDTMGRVMQITKAGGLVQYYTYDGLGQRLRHWNSQFGAGDAETTDYDIQGRIVSQRSFGGDVTTTSYVWDNTIATNGLGTFGGWNQTTAYTNGKTKTERKDFSGRMSQMTDLGGRTTTFDYDSAGRLTHYVASGIEANRDRYVSWFNIGQRATVTTADGVTSFGYDALGSITREQLLSGGIYLKDQTAAYDALGRMISWNDAGGVTIPAASLAITYDANGNVRSRQTSYSNTVGGPVYGFTDWYRYDSMNRMVTDRGVLSGGFIVRGTDNSETGTTGGTDYQYNLAGERVLALHSAIYRLYGWDPVHDAYYNNYYVPLEYRVDYVYDNDGQLVQAGKTDDRFGWGPGYEPIAITNPRVVAQSYTRDLMGRATQETSGSSTTTTTWNNKSQVTQTIQSSGGTTTTTDYNYLDSGGLYLLGQAGSIVSTQGGNTQTTTYSYVWYDGAVKTQASITGTGAQSAGVTDYTLDAFGLVRSTATYGGYTGSQSYIYDAADQGIVHAESYNAQSWSDNWYRMGGVNIWHYSNRFGFNAQTGDSNGLGGRYSVRSGDTLQGIAQQLWGDANLWYKIAEANGLTASSSLTDGQSLVIPAGVFRNHQTAQTFLPYDQGRFLQLAEPSPLFPSPAAKGGKCGVFGQILLAAIAVAVTLLLTPASGATFGQLLLGAVAGNVASQAVGLATGIQDKFSFKGVALAALSAGVGAGVGSVVKGAVAGSKFLGDVIRGAVSSAVTQGVATATGLQDKFSWTGVAAAGIGAGVGGAVSRSVGGQAVDAVRDSTGNIVTSAKAASFGNNLASSMADAIASAATRSAISGTSFGDNLLQSVPNAIANTIGRAIGQAAANEITDSRIDRLLADPKTPVSLRNDPDARSTLRDFIDTGISNRQLRGLIRTGDVGSAAQARRDYQASRVLADGTIVVSANLNNQDYQPINAVYRPDANRAHFMFAGQSSTVPYLRSLHNEAITFSGSHSPIRGTREWTAEELVGWQASGGNEYVFEFKRQWVSGYRDAIIAAADRFDIPAELLAGVAYNEVAGDPLWIDDAAYAVRPEGNGLGQRDRTSFGNVSIQVRRASEALGYGDSTALGWGQRRWLIDSLKNPISNIFIVAKHLSDIRDINYRGNVRQSLSYEQLIGIGTRYNRGPNLTESQVNQNNGYGLTIVNRLPAFRRMIGRQ